MKKTLIIFTIFLIQLNAFSQKQLRDYVVIVKPVYHATTIDFLNKFSDKLRSKNYIDAADYLKSFSEGKGFGSGFLVKGPNNKTYILTNRHVVMQAEKVNIEFSSTDGGKVNYNDCKILDIDDNSDLALLELPEGVTINRSLNLYQEPVDEGKEVISAGFPGLAGKPSWQLGKGIISNAAFSMSNFDEAENILAIQHTAQIDRGSSGSPLLISDPTQATGYSVIGMNTWKVQNRENVNLSIPVKNIVRFIAEAINKGNLDKNETLEKNSRQFVSDAMQGYKKVLKYISYNYISKVSIDNFFELVDKSSKDAQKDIYDAFSESQHPIEAVRIAIADALVRSIEKNKNTFNYSSIAGIASNNNPTTVLLSLNNKPVTSSWIIEQNKWKINDISSLKITDMNQRIGFVKNFDIENTISVEMCLPGNDLEKTGYGLEYSYGDKFYLGAGIHKYAHHAYNSEYDYDKHEYVTTKVGYVNYNNIGIHLGYRYPFQVKRCYLMPFAQAHLGMNTGQVSFITGSIKYGLQLGYKIKESKYIFIHLSTVSRSVTTEHAVMSSSEMEYSNIYGDGDKFNMFNLGINYCF